MNKKNYITILVLFAILLCFSWIFRSYPIDFYYKNKFEQQVNTFKEYIDLIVKNSDENNFNILLTENSKLLNPEIQKLLISNLEKVDIETMQIAWGRRTMPGESINECVLHVYFDGDKTSMVKTVMLKKQSEMTWKIEDIFLLDHYFDDN